MDTFVNPLKNSVRNVSQIVKSMPDNFADGVAKMSGGIKSIPSNMLDGVGKMLNVRGVSSHNSHLMIGVCSHDEGFIYRDTFSKHFSNHYHPL